VNSHRTVVVSILLGLAPFLAGCGKKNNVERLPVHGTVTLANGERFNGSITFRPANGRPGPAATTKLADGSYEFDRSNGPTAGPQTVIVMRIVPRADVLQALASQSSAAQHSASRTPPTRPAGKPATPRETTPKANAEWTDAADVPADGQFLCDFKLKN